MGESEKIEIKKEDILHMHSALSEYHSTIVSSRFAVAGLYMAGTAFLVQVIFAESILLFTKYTIATFGLILTIAMWLLEIRNVNLLDNIGDSGRDIEKKLNLKKEDNFGFFLLMKDQEIAPRLPFIPKERKFSTFPSNKVVKYFISHSFGLSLIYFSSLVFWGIILLKIRK